MWEICADSGNAATEKWRCAAEVMGGEGEIWLGGL